MKNAYIILSYSLTILFQQLTKDGLQLSQRVNGDETMSFEEAVSRLKQAYLDKLEWLNQHIGNK